MEKINIYEMVTDKIIEKLEAGIVPWRKPWVNGQHNAVSWKSQKAYRGINALLLEPGEYATFKQIKEAGGNVKKGAKSEVVVFWKWLEDEKDGKIEKIPLLRYYRVFNIATQAEGIESKRKIEATYEHNPIEEAENIINGYIDSPTMSFESGVGAWYKPTLDIVNVPPIKDFEQIEEYYTTAFHELVHSTGHAKRLNREGVTAIHRFGDEVYSKEELVAEIGAQMLASIAGIDNNTIENAVAYIKSWLHALKDDKTLIVKAGAQAQKAVDKILNTKFDTKGE